MSTSKNSITGDLIHTKQVTDQYRNNFDAIFRKSKDVLLFEHSHVTKDNCKDTNNVDHK